MISKEIHFQNFGKVKDAHIRMRPFTMITGHNSSGKSFITRALYSVFYTLNQDLIAKFLVQNIDFIIKAIDKIGHDLIRITQKDAELLVDLEQDFFALKRYIGEKFESVSIFQDRDILRSFQPQVQELIQRVDELKSSLQAGKGTKFQSVAECFNELDYNLLQLNSSIESWDRFYTAELDRELRLSFLGNFQVNSLSKLKFLSNESKISIGESLISIRNDNLMWKLEHSIISDLQAFHNVVYLESPIYLKLRKTLQESRFQNLGFSRRNVLNQVPKYFYDIDKLLSNDYIAEKIPDKIINIIRKIDNGINGQLSMDSRNNIIFYDSEYPDIEIPFNLVSSGISNLGIIALLLKKNILTKGSFLFIDEPELNLHTEWQHLMLEILVDLSQAGVNVMVASHSLDMVLRLQNIVENFKDQDSIEDFFSLNRLAKNGTTFESKGILQDIRDAKADLGKPYVDLLKQRLP